MIRHALSMTTLSMLLSGARPASALLRQARVPRSGSRLMSATSSEDILSSTLAAADTASLQRLFALRGYELLDRTARADLHPFAVPLAKDENGDVLGVLRWPTPEEGRPLPVIRTRPRSAGMELLSTSTELYLKRQVVEAAENGGDAASVAKLCAGEETLELWTADAKKDATTFLLLKVGPFPDLYREMARRHLERGSEDAALVACERANDLFKGWGTAYAYYADVLTGLSGRAMEARDAARVALRMPIWTLGGAYDGSFEENVERCAELADYTGTSALKLMYAKLADDKREEEVAGGRLPEQVALDRSAFYMDAVACGLGAEEGSWASDEVRGKLAGLYREAGLADVAEFVEATA